MPFVGFICEITGAPVAPNVCLDCAQRGGQQQKGQRCPFTPPLIRGLIASHQPRGLLGYSATELSGCPRKILLKERVPYWVAPGNAYWAFRGQLAHALLERESDPASAICERRLYAECDGFLITGQPDVVYPQRQTLVDYKTTKRVPQPRQRYTCPACQTVIRETPWRARKGSTLTCPACGWQGRAGSDIGSEETPPVPYARHVQQLNVYRWLLARNGIPITQAEILYLDMSQPLLLPVPLWELETTGAIIQAGLARLTACGPDGLPEGVQDDAEANWECRFCPVVTQCQAVRAQGSLDAFLATSSTKEL